MEKHLFYYTSHSQFSEPTNKPSVSYCEQEDEVHYAAAGSVTLITFTIAGDTYQAEEGMTWGDWVNSIYNTNNEFELRSDLDVYVVVKTTDAYYRICLNNYTDVHSTDKVLSHSYLFRKVTPEAD